MKRLIMIAMLAAPASMGCGSAMSTPTVLQPGAFVGDRSYEERGKDRLAFELQTRSRLAMSDPSR